MEISYNAHVKRIILVLVILAGLFFPVKWLLTPASFGTYGYYRADAINEEADRNARHMTNASCLTCHEHENDNLLIGMHKTLSCEFCHGPYADHVQNNKKTEALPVKAGEEIVDLCLRCHNNEIIARPKNMIKTVVMPDHLKDQGVQETHSCNQCHYVHAPLKYINRPQRVAGMQEDVNG